MIEVNVNNTISGDTFRADFEDQAAADEWIAKQEEKAQKGKGWGWAERWIPNTESYHPSLFIEEVDGQIHLKAEYVISSTVPEEDIVKKRIGLGVERGRMMQDIRNYILGFNIEVDAKEADEDNLELALLDFYKQFDKGKISKAKKEWIKFVPFGIYNQDFKDGVLEIFTRYGV